MITDLLLKLLIIAYASTGVVATIGYLPTIKDLWYHKKKSANTSSYIIWTSCALIVFLYSLFILNDLLFRVVSGANFACCATVLILSILLGMRK